MQMYTNLKETGQAYVLMRTQKRYLKTIDEVATASPRPPRLSLAQSSQEHKFDTSNMPLFSMERLHFIGFGGLNTMERITH